MKQHLFILTFLLFSTNLFAQKLTNKQIENDLVKLYEKIISFPYGGMKDTYDSIEYYDSLFAKKIAFYTAHHPSTLAYPFLSLKKQISIATSADGRFRIYSWDTWDGGTMHRTANLLQFKIGDKVYSKYPSYENHAHEDWELWFHSIDTLMAKDKTYYLALGHGRYATQRVGGGIHVFYLNDHTLIDTVKLFRTKKGLVPSLGYGYQLGTLRDADKDIPPLFDSITHIIALPLDDPRGKATGKYDLYQFNGKYFEYIKTKNTAE